MFFKVILYLKSTFEALAGLHQVLHVVDAGEVQTQKREEIAFILKKRFNNIRKSPSKELLP
jgi:hypothetical protein